MSYKQPSKMYMPNTLWTWSFTAAALIQAIICLGLEAYVFGEFQSSLLPASNGEKGALLIPTYLTIFIFGFIYQLLLVWDALRLKNTIQVIGICIYNLGMMIYAAVEMDQVDEAIDELELINGIDITTWVYLRPCLIAAPCVLALGTVILSLIAWKLYDEFAWTIYKHISADLRLKRRYLTYQIYIALLKFDFFFFLGFTVQFLVVVGSKTETYEFALTIAALPITIVLLFLAAYLTRRESYIGQGFIIVLYFAGMAYFAFKLVRMYSAAKQAQYSVGRSGLMTFAVLAILLLVVTIGGAIATMRNFDKGLKPHVQRRKVAGLETGASDGKYAGAGGGSGYGGGGSQGYQQSGGHPLSDVGGPGRMTID